MASEGAALLESELQQLENVKLQMQANMPQNKEGQLSPSAEVHQAPQL